MPPTQTQWPNSTDMQEFTDAVTGIAVIGCTLLRLRGESPQAPPPINSIEAMQQKANELQLVMAKFVL